MQPNDPLLELRRALHRIPELGFVEHKTSTLLWERAQKNLGPPSRIGDTTGFFVDLGDPEASRTLLLRADMDGLPVQEETGLPFASEHEGRMHACGHDAHMAALTHACEVMTHGLGLPEDLRLRVLYQPAEEGSGGALRCMAEGVLDGVDHAFGLHVWNELPVGTVAVTAGGIMAGVTDFRIRVVGRGGHGGLPHQAVDPIVASAHLITALQTVASRRSSPFEPVVVSVGAIHAGDAFNVIPERVDLAGTARTFSVTMDEEVEQDVRAIAAGIAAATGTTIEIDWTRECIATVNAHAFSQLVRDAAIRAGFSTVLTDYRTTAGEDFGYILNPAGGGVEGAYVLVGSGNPEKGCDEPHHSPRFKIDEDVLPLAAALHQEVVRSYAESFCEDG